jgi:hypothetical protein
MIRLDVQSQETSVATNAFHQTFASKIHSSYTVPASSSSILIFNTSVILIPPLQNIDTDCVESLPNRIQDNQQSPSFFLPTSIASINRNHNLIMVGTTHHQTSINKKSSTQEIQGHLPATLLRSSVQPIFWHTGQNTASGIGFIEKPPHQSWLEVFLFWLAPQGFEPSAT